MQCQLMRLILILLISSTPEFASHKRDEIIDTICLMCEYLGCYARFLDSSTNRWNPAARQAGLLGWERERTHWTP
jgi:hypothetical protein